MSHYQGWSAPAAFIFDWSKRADDFTIYRITKEIISTEEGQVPRYLQYLGSYGIREMIESDLEDLKSGRRHWRGEVNATWDYWGEFDEHWEPNTITRIG